jgi:hypothetical protein
VVIAAAAVGAAAVDLLLLEFRLGLVLMPLLVEPLQLLLSLLRGLLLLLLWVLLLLLERLQLLLLSVLLHHFKSVLLPVVEL